MADDVYHALKDAREHGEELERLRSENARLKADDAKKHAVDVREVRSWMWAFGWAVLFGFVVLALVQCG